MWQFQTSLLEPAEPTHLLQRRVAGKRTLTAALPRRSGAPAVGAAEEAAIGGEEARATNDEASRGASGAGADPFWFAGADDRLPGGVQRQMEASFGADFSDVRVRVGGEAAERGAVAFARGDELQFAPGHYDPTSPAGLELIGHELAHVVQQRQGRAAAAQGKGGVVDDAALEAEADLAGSRAARGLPAGLGSVGASRAGGASALQRKPTTVGVVERPDNHSVTLQLLRSLITQHALSHLLESIESVVLWWSDTKVRDLAKAVLDRAFSASIKEAVQALSAVVTPYLAVLQQVRTYYKLLPDVVQNLMIFTMGSGLVGLLGWMKVSHNWSDWVANGIFLDGGSFITKIEWVAKQLSDLCTRPASWLYNIVWSSVRGSFGSSAPSPVAALVEPPAPAAAAAPAAAPAPAPAPAAAPAQAPADEQAEAAAAKKKAEEAKRDLRYLWLDIDPPKLGRFDHDKRKAGGLILPFQFGVNLFGTKLKAKGDQQELHVPWGGGFAVDLKDIEIDAPLRFEPIFSVGKVLLSRVKVTEKGLEALHVTVSQMKFADDAVVMSELTADYVKGQGLALSGAAAVTVHGKAPIHTTGSLTLDGNGDFEKGSLTVSTPAAFTIIDPYLVMKSPKLAGSIDKHHNIALGLSSDIASKFSFVDLDAKGAHLDYKKGQGHELSGGVEKLTVKLGEHVTLSGDGVELGRRGITAKELGLEYRHDPSAAGRASEQLSTIGGIPPELLSFTGVSSLVIGGKVLGLRIGPPPKPLVAEGAQVAVPQQQPAQLPGAQAQAAPWQVPGQAAAPAPKLGSKESTFHVDGVQPKISKLGANAFGMHAALDLEKPEVTLGGKVDYKPDIPSVGFEAHFLPGLALAGSLAPKVSLAAAISGTGSVPRKDAFALTGTVEASAELALLASLNLQVGTSLIAALRAGVFAEGKLTVAAKAAATGVVEVDRERRAVRASERPEEQPRVRFSADADVTASVGVVVSGHAFLVFDRELYRYTFKEWKFGLYHLEGEIDLDGKPKVDEAASRFVKDDKRPAEPGVDRKPEPDALAKLMSKEAIQGSAEMRKQLLRQLRAGYKDSDAATLAELDRAGEAARQFEADFAEHREQLALKAARQSQGVIPQADLQALESWKGKMLEHDKAIAVAKESYRRLQLLLLKDVALADSAIEEGGLNLAGMEEAIREAAAACDADKAQVARKGAAAAKPSPSSAAAIPAAAIAAAAAPAPAARAPQSAPPSLSGAQSGPPTGPPSSNQG